MIGGNHRISSSLPFVEPDLSQAIFTPDVDDGVAATPDLTERESAT
jgi:hypothetical protein